MKVVLSFLDLFLYQVNGFIRGHQFIRLLNLILPLLEVSVWVIHLVFQSDDLSLLFGEVLGHLEVGRVGLHL